MIYATLEYFYIHFLVETSTLGLKNNNPTPSNAAICNLISFTLVNQQWYYRDKKLHCC